MIMCQLIIDTRERGLIDELNKHGIPHQIKQLELADILFEGPDELLLAIERKTMKDLEQSNKDGRYREQRSRLINNYVQKGIRVWYLIEGFGSACGLSMNTSLSIFVNLMIRDNIGVYHTRHVQDTALFLKKLKEKFEVHPAEVLFGGKNTEIGEYLSTIKLRKKENLDSKSIYILQLAQIPGMSVKSAEAIQEMYKTMASLCKACEEKGTEVVVNIVVGKRKIGKVLSKRIYDSLIGT
jgi:ERCC4-type nuclease